MAKAAPVGTRESPDATVHVRESVLVVRVPEPEELTRLPAAMTLALALRRSICNLFALASILTNTPPLAALSVSFSVFLNADSSVLMNSLFGIFSTGWSGNQSQEMGSMSPGISEGEMGDASCRVEGLW